MAGLRILGAAIALALVGVDAGPCKPVSLSIIGPSSLGQSTAVTEAPSTTISKIESTSVMVEGTSSTIASEHEGLTTFQSSVTSSEPTFSFTYEEIVTTTADLTTLSSTAEAASTPATADGTTKEETAIATTIGDSTSVAETSATTAVGDTTTTEGTSVTTAEAHETTSTFQSTTTTTEPDPIPTLDLPNPGFEDPSKPWIETSDSNSIARVQESTAEFPARSGGYSTYMGILKSTNKPPKIKQTISGMKPGSQYVISAWFALTRDLNPASGPYCYNYIVIGGKSAMHRFDEPVQPLVYSKKEITVTASTNSDVVEISMYCVRTGGPHSAVLVDDVSIVEVV